MAAAVTANEGSLEPTRNAEPQRIHACHVDADDRGPRNLPFRRSLPETAFICSRWRPPRRPRLQHRHARRGARRATPPAANFATCRCLSATATALPAPLAAFQPPTACDGKEAARPQSAASRPQSAAPRPQSAAPCRECPTLRAALRAAQAASRESEQSCEAALARITRLEAQAKADIDQAVGEALERDAEEREASRRRETEALAACVEARAALAKMEDKEASARRTIDELR